MDAAYDAEHIRKNSRSLGHVPLIDISGRPHVFNFEAFAGLGVIFDASKSNSSTALD